MDLRAITQTNDGEPSAHTEHHTACRRLANSQNETLSHFVYDLDQSHVQGGYWRFQSAEDYRRANAYGITTPEELLVQTDNSDEKHDDITILWIRENNDLNLRSALAGTASQHLRTIYELRNLLDLPMSSRGQIPTYPDSTDVRLKEYWERMCKVQSSVPTVQAPQATGQQTLSSTTPRFNLADLSHSSQGPPEPQVTSSHFAEQVQVTLLPPAECTSRQSHCGADVVFAKQTVHTSLLCEHTTNLKYDGQEAQAHDLLLETVASSALRPATVQLQDVATIASTTVDLPGLSYDSVYDISTDSSVSMCEEPLATSIIIHSRIKAPTLVHTNTSIMPKKRNKGLGSEAAVASAELSPQITNLPPYIDLKDLITLPCMDCGSDDNHKWDCHLGSLKFKEELTILDYRILADAVERFDPGPWTTHFDQFPETEPENPRTQIAGMAEVVRQEDSYKEDVELHGLPDDLMILLWAFKTSGGVEVIDM